MILQLVELVTSSGKLLFTPFIFYHQSSCTSEKPFIEFNFKGLSF